MKRYRIKMVAKIALFLALISLLSACNKEQKEKQATYRDLPEIQQMDTLRVLTLYGPMSYFNYKDNEMGYEYEFAKELCKELGVEMQLTVVKDLGTMLSMLENGEGDVVAYRVPYTLENKDRVAYTERSYITNQVVVQCKSDTMMRNVMDLSGKDVYVIDHSKYKERLTDLNNEIGGGINIHAVDDTLTAEYLIAQVAHHKINASIADNDVARLNKTYFGNLDYNLKVSFDQRSAWVVNKNAPQLLEYVNNWSKNVNRKTYFSSIYRKYFEKSKYFESQGYAPIPSASRISSFDDYFKRYASIVNWDWRLIAAVAYKESKFDPNIVSWAGACGLMQLMPKTAISLGLTEDEFHVAEKNIQAGVTYLKNLEKYFTQIEDKNERTKFILASYNSGPGHVFDARALANKYGKNMDVWDDVAPYMLLKSSPEYYSDEVCKYGYCRGEETVNYVKDITAKYEQYKLWAK